VEIDVGFGCVRRHERHIVEGREQNAAIERIEMHEALEIKVGRGSGFCAIARRVRAEEILGAAAEARCVPWQARGVDSVGDAFCKSLRERNHTGERLRRKNVFERRADCGERESISCEGAANSACIAVFQVNAVSDFLGDLGGAAIRSGGQTASDGLANDEEIGPDGVFASVAAGASTNGVSFVDD